MVAKKARRDIVQKSLAQAKVYGVGCWEPQTSGLLGLHSRSFTFFMSIPREQKPRPS